MSAKRNPETGKFMTKAEIEAAKTTETVATETPKVAKAPKAKAPKAEKTTTKVAPKAKAPKGEMKVQILINPLAVFSKKDLAGNPSNIKPGTTVQLTEVTPSLIRVKKENSSRTFYTNPEAIEAAV